MAEKVTSGKAATSTETQAAAHKAGFPPFEAQHFPSQLLWLAITFCAIYLFVSKVVVKRVGGTIAGRASRISRDLDEAAAAKTRADEATAAYEKSLAEARDKAQQLARETRDATNASSETRRKAVEAELSAKLAGADREIAARKTAAMANVSAIAQDTAAAIIDRLTGEAASSSELASALTAAARS
jgi:F-type H+-transporting ATPase subunit b